jgi:hypothetical protein
LAASKWSDCRWIGGLAIQIIFFGGPAGKISQQANQYIVMMPTALLVGFGIYQIWVGAYNLLADVRKVALLFLHRAVSSL